LEQSFSGNSVETIPIKKIKEKKELQPKTKEVSSNL
jgi:hypothetical protein